MFKRATKYIIVIQEAKQSGVASMLNVSYDERSVSHSISLSKKYSFIYAAIGEIGLDFFRGLSPRELQKEWFVKQIQLAKKLKCT